MKKAYAAISGIIAVSVLAFFIFVPAFRGTLQINPVMQIGSLQIRWYGLIFAGAILASYFVARKNSWKFGISVNAVDDYAFWATLVGFIGARSYFIIFNYDYFFRNLSEMYKVWHGGLSIYGGVLAGLAFTYFYSKKKAYTFWQLFDLIALALPLGQAIGRLGNFVNQEAYGLPTNLPWKMYVAPQNRPIQLANEKYFHPTFLYELILDLLIFGMLYKLLGKTKSGVLGFIYLASYSLGRFFIEAIRLDSFIIQGFRVDQIVAFILVVLAGFYGLRRQSKSSL